MRGEGRVVTALENMDSGAGYANRDELVARRDLLTRVLDDTKPAPPPVEARAPEGVRIGDVVRGPDGMEGVVECVTAVTPAPTEQVGLRYDDDDDDLTYFALDEVRVVSRAPAPAAPAPRRAVVGDRVEVTIREPGEVVSIEDDTYAVRTSNGTYRYVKGGDVRWLA